MYKDFRLALRRMAQQPALSALAVLSLGLGIAANAAVLSTAYPALFSPLPFPEPDRLVTVVCDWGGQETVLSDAEVIYLRQASTAFSQVAVRSPWNAPLSGDGLRRPVSALRVSANYLRTLGVQPALGRGFLEAPESGLQDAVLGDQLWRTRFGADPDILGRILQLGGEQYTVVGVMPARGIDDQTELWVTVQLDPDSSSRGKWPLLARLRDGVSLQQARREADLLHQQYLREHRPRYQGHLVVERLRDSVLDGSPWFGGRPVRHRLYAILGLLGFLLLMGCANVANLLMIRAHSRQREIALRKALGAGKGRIAAQLLSEGLAFALLAGVVGLLMALATGGLVGSFGQGLDSLPGRGEPNHFLLAFGVGLTVLCGLLGGLVPALASARFPSRGPSFAGGESLADRFALRTHGRFSRAFIFVQVALTAILLMGAGVTLKSSAALYRVDFGLQPDDVIKLDVSLPPNKYSAPVETDGGTQGKGLQFHSIRPELDLLFGQIAESLNRLAGVQQVAATGRFENDGCSAWFVLPGQPPFNLADAPSMDSPLAQICCLRPINPDYFAALQIPLQNGRSFRSQDSASAAPVAIINQAMAQRFWPGEDPLGERIQLVFDGLREPGAPQWQEIVAVVGDTRHSRIEQTPQPTVYVPHSQLPTQAQMRLATRFKMTFLLRHPPARPPQPEKIAQAIGALDPDATLTKVEALQAALDGSFDQTLFYTRLFTLLAGMGLLLSASGIYGVTAFAVRLRSTEISVRKAVGAKLWDVIRLIAGQNLWTILIGLGAGLTVALASAQTLSSLIFGVQAEDYLTFSAASAFILTLALAASLLPVRRTYRSDPSQLLRLE